MFLEIKMEENAKCFKAFLPTCQTGKEIDKFWNLESHLDIELLEMIDCRYDWCVPSNIALKKGVIDI